jgi:D-glycero-D-manno-heptose 1,7-bisphosphate phosphatase
MRRAIILDRDGTLVEHLHDTGGNKVSAVRPGDLRLLPGAVAGLRLLRDAGYLLGIATNQPGAAKGQCAQADITATNRALVAMLDREGVDIAAVAMCPHHPVGAPGGDAELVCECRCRKPRPKLVLALLELLGAKAKNSWMVGDQDTDTQCGLAAGMKAARVSSRRTLEDVARMIVEEGKR